MGGDGDLEPAETPPKLPPVAHDDHITVPEDDPGNVGHAQRLMNDEDVSFSASSNPTFEVVTPPQHGTLGSGHGYQPVPGYFGPDSLTYSPMSPAETSAATVTIEITSDGVPCESVQRLDRGAAFASRTGISISTGRSTS
ncbi:MAG: hypothetical protein JNL83_14470 [Myxococcales bacterium]|nr:hypothetical protein [Myxococcales bacterium]